MHDSHADITALLSEQRAEITRLRAERDSAAAELATEVNRIARMRGALKALCTEADNVRGAVPQRVAIAIDLLASAHLEPTHGL